MSNLFKDMAVLLFSAGDELEKKAGEFKNLREDRYKEFEEKVKNKQEEFKDKSTEIKNMFGDEIKKVEENILEFTEKIGFASKKEVDSLNQKIDDLSKKLDQLLAEKNLNRNYFCDEKLQKTTFSSIDSIYKDTFCIWKRI